MSLGLKPDREFAVMESPRQDGFPPPNRASNHRVTRGVGTKIDNLLLSEKVTSLGNESGNKDDWFRYQVLGVSSAKK
jgi:hypothetical protein